MATRQTEKIRRYCKQTSMLIRDVDQSEADLPADCTAEVEQVRPAVSAIVVSFNTRQMTLDCLHTLADELGQCAADIWLVDNASTDGTVDAVAAAMPHVKIIANSRNAGFGAANNQAMRQAQGEFILLLNSDAFPQQGAVAALLDYMRAHPDVGVAGPRLLNADKSLQISCFRFPSPGFCWAENLWAPILFPRSRAISDYRRWAHDRERDVDWVVGACMMIRAEAYRVAGGFDERFFMYAEETDWQRRIRRAGWRVCFTPAGNVVHLGRGSAKAGDGVVDGHFFQSLDRYQLKHHGWAGLVSLRMAMIVGCSARALAWSLVGVVRPGRGQVAWNKARFHCRLAWRQATVIPRLKEGRTL